VRRHDDPEIDGEPPRFPHSWERAVVEEEKGPGLGEAL